ncbi:30S ribosomal protein S8 [Lentisphaera araneosa HTCC2155]|jgi:small subunit ribosomal protein S8|uniref:Small ribosomal subunit protein uS8 n=1 Tax=Lentisphaera araneosa HTCC2155 TaxID=313628 RepID=A6DRC4_9BACT|nr:30S ribosomal protein S8 [Lentisphaera araneosa]EDM25871.1 30S ribosomal protein S8 [Lentisphaera araneosa HTCC2155]
MNDTIADFLTRLRNAGMANLAELNMPSSKVNASISSILKEEGYIADYDVVELENNKKDLKVQLKYHKGQPLIQGLKRVSKGSCRIFVKADEIPRVRGGLGIAVISTSKGMMTGQKAKSENIGGEVVALVW